MKKAQITLVAFFGTILRFNISKILMAASLILVQVKTATAPASNRYW
jgi:hypothetical protein